MPTSSWHACNKEKAAEDHRRWRENNREYDLQRKRDWYYKEGRNRDLIKLYGITLKDYDDMHSSQKGCCAICDKTEETLNVDHSHVTGRVRGLLCYDCNRNFIGSNEDPEKYFRAGRYLQDGTRKKI